jgi:hypothetical protein
MHILLIGRAIFAGMVIVCLRDSRFGLAGSGPRPLQSFSGPFATSLHLLCYLGTGTPFCPSRLPRPYAAKTGAARVQAKPEAHCGLR